MGRLIKFKVGDSVIFQFERVTNVRKVTDVYPSSRWRGGFAISVDGGTKCPKCGYECQALFDVNPAWFMRVKT